MNIKAFSLLAVAALALAAPASAHHSFAMFDSAKTVTLTGTVKEFEWTNPHAWLRVMVDDQTTGKPMQWALEMGSPGQQAQRGWKPDSVKPGDKVVITLHPLKDGSRGGQLLSAQLPGGQQLTNGGNRNNPVAE
ncbi:MAG TPA: DUF6152 family protein [Micropepsaceae bacterium]|nr:DUF6152 family protein [Micropepsaceae bacterium]